jgi:hypothetical protein
MRGLVIIGLLGATAHGAAAEARGLRLPTLTTLATVPGCVEGFAQDGSPWGAQTRSRARIGRFAAGSYLCTPRG